MNILFFFGVLLSFVSWAASDPLPAQREHGDETVPLDPLVNLGRFGWQPGNVLKYFGHEAVEVAGQVAGTVEREGVAAAHKIAHGAEVALEDSDEVAHKAMKAADRLAHRLVKDSKGIAHEVIEDTKRFRESVRYASVMVRNGVIERAGRIEHVISGGLKMAATPGFWQMAEEVALTADWEEYKDWLRARLPTPVAKEAIDLVYEYGVPIIQKIVVSMARFGFGR